jgi:Xaa-Pro aminopeptidase
LFIVINNKEEMKKQILRGCIALFCLLQFACLLNSQTTGSSDSKRLSAGFYQGRREALRQMMPANSVFVLFASPERTFAGDVDYVYHQNPDLYYFSGYLEPNSMMYIFKEPQSIKGITNPVSEVLFTPPQNAQTVTFTGKKMGAGEAMEELGVQLAIETSKYATFPIDLSAFKMILTDRIPTDVRDDDSNSGLSVLIMEFRKKTGIKDQPGNLSVMLTNYITELKGDRIQKEFIRQVKSYIAMQPDKVNLDPILTRWLDSPDSAGRAKLQDSIINMQVNYLYFNRFTAALRQIKTAEEIAVIRKAIDITCAGQREVMKATTPEMSEREIQGIHEFIYKLKGASEIGFPLIIASGNNGCILHYQDNDVPKVGNNLVLMDVGAMLNGYSADVTRTIPANGKFTPEQLAIYNIVLQAQDSAFSYCKAGMPYTRLDYIGRKIIGEGLKKLGLIDSAEKVSTYYPHGISHPIGLDVHDKYNFQAPLSNDMIITLEPGIYIPVGSACDKKWWGIAVRIEDDVLISNNNPVNLSLAAPRKAIDIEKIMKETSPFNQLK